MRPQKYCNKQRVLMAIHRHKKEMLHFLTFSNKSRQTKRTIVIKHSEKKKSKVGSVQPKRRGAWEFISIIIEE